MNLSQRVQRLLHEVDVKKGVPEPEPPDFGTETTVTFATKALRDEGLAALNDLPDGMPNYEVSPDGKTLRFLSVKNDAGRVKKAVAHLKKLGLLQPDQR